MRASRHVLLLCLLSIVFACPPGKFPFIMKRSYKLNAYQESITFYKGTQTGPEVWTLQGESSDSSMTYEYMLCLEDTMHTVVLRDTGSTGWGSTGQLSSFTLYYDSIPFLYGQMPYSLRSGYNEEVLIFKPGFQKMNGTAIVYTDVPQSNHDWTQAAFDQSSWTAANGGALPVNTKVTRYYRTSIVPTAPEQDVFTLNIDVRIDCGFVLYVNGKEYKRYLMPKSEIHADLQPTTGRQDSPGWVTIELTKYEVNLQSPLLIAVETHRLNSDRLIPDAFDIVVHYQYLSHNTCSLSRMDPLETVYACSTTAYSTTYSCNRAFDSSPSSYFYTRYSTTELTLTNKLEKSMLITSYGVRSASTTSYGYPRGWTLYGYNDNQTPVVLDQQSGILFGATKVLHTFNLPSNRVPYSNYKLKITDATSSGKISLSAFELYACNTEILPVGIHYPVTSFNVREGSTFAPMAPLNSGYNNYALSTPVNNNYGLTVDPQTGVVSGDILHAGTLVYTVSATNNADGLTYNCTLTFVSTACTYPEFQIIRVTKVLKANAAQESFKIYASNNTLLFASSPFANNVNFQSSFCFPTEEITFVMEDTNTSGWTDLATLTVEAYNGGQYHTLAIAFLYNMNRDSFKVNLKSQIPSNSSWKYIDGTVPPQWYSASFQDSAWSNYVHSSDVASTSNVQLFRYSFTTDSLANQTSLLFDYKARAGHVIYVNGQEVYRQALPAGDITSSSQPIASDTTVTWRTLVLPVSALNKNANNVISVALVNLPAYLNQNIDFDAFMMYMPFTSKYPRTFGMTVTSTSSGGTPGYLVNACYSSTYSSNCPAGQVVNITIAYGNHRAETVNKYCITNASSRKSDPSDWELYGSNDNQNFLHIASETNVQYSASKQTLCFYAVDNVRAYNTYRFVLKEPWIKEPKYVFVMSEIGLTTIDFSSMNIPPFTLTPTLINAVVGTEFPAVIESHEAYRDFEITPALPAPLEIDTTTGIIRGVVNMPFSGDYSISARGLDGVRQTVSVHINVAPCTTPNHLITLEFFTGANGGQQGFYLYPVPSGASLLSSYSMLPNEHLFYHTCTSVTSFSLTLTDSIGDGWDNSKYLIYLDNDMLLDTGSVSYGVYNKYLYFDVNLLMKPGHEQWRYHLDSTPVPSNWKDSSDGSSSWPSGITSDYEDTETITTYYTHTLSRVSSSFAALEFMVQIQCGAIFYMNGQEFYRQNLPEGEIGPNTYAISRTNSTQTKFTYSTQFGYFDIDKSNYIAIELHKCQDSQYSDKLILGMKGVASYTNRAFNGDITSDTSSSYYADLPFYLFDGEYYTVARSGPRCVGTTFTYTFDNNRKEYINSYSLTNDYECNRRAPSGWKILGSNNPDSVDSWVVLDEKTAQSFTMYSETRNYTFLNTEAYRSYRFTVTQCSNRDIYEYESYCSYGPWGEGQGFSLAEITYYSVHLPNACKRVDGYPATVNGATSTRPCEMYYVGHYQRKCQNGVYGPEENLCLADVPKFFNYTTRLLDLVTGSPMTPLIPTVIGAEYRFKVTPPLPSGLSLNPVTGEISGTPVIEIPSRIYRVSCMTVSGSLDFPISIQVKAAPTPDYTIYIIICVVVVIVVLIVVLVVMNKNKKAKKSHLRLAEKTSKQGAKKPSQKSKEGKVLKV